MATRGGLKGAGVTVDGDIEFLFNSHGGVVAFRHGRDVFDLDLGWLGWAPWNDGDVFDPAGRYLGTMTPEGRLYEIEVRRDLASPPPPTPTTVSYPDLPRGCAPERLAAGMRDVRPRQLVRPHELTGPVAADGDAALVSEHPGAMPPQRRPDVPILPVGCPRPCGDRPRETQPVLARPATR